MIILDTDCLSILERESGPDFLILSRNLARFRAEDVATTIISFDEDAARIFQGLKQQKLRVGTMDSRIAAIPLARDATLISRNLVDFERIPGLTVEDWTRDAYIN